MVDFATQRAGSPEPSEFFYPEPAQAQSVQDLAPRAIAPRVIDFATYWLRRRPAPGVMPARAHLDPLDIPNLLPVIYLVDVVRGEHTRYRWRLRGTELEFVSGRTYTGMFFEESYPDFAVSRAKRQFDAVLAGASCWWLGYPNSTRPRDVSHVERLILPLAADGRTVDMMIGVTIFTLKN